MNIDSYRRKDGKSSELKIPCPVEGCFLSVTRLGQHLKQPRQTTLNEFGIPRVNRKSVGEIVEDSIFGVEMQID